MTRDMAEINKCWKINYTNKKQEDREDARLKKDSTDRDNQKTKSSLKLKW